MTANNTDFQAASKKEARMAAMAQRIDDALAQDAAATLQGSDAQQVIDSYKAAVEQAQTDKVFLSTDILAYIAKGRVNQNPPPKPVAVKKTAATPPPLPQRRPQAAAVALVKKAPPPPPRRVRPAVVAQAAPVRRPGVVARLFALFGGRKRTAQIGAVVLVALTGLGALFQANRKSAEMEGVAVKATSSLQAPVVQAVSGLSAQQKKIPAVKLDTQAMSAVLTPVDFTPPPSLSSAVRKFAEANNKGLKTSGKSKPRAKAVTGGSTIIKSGPFAGMRFVREEELFQGGCTVQPGQNKAKLRPCNNKVRVYDMP